MKATKTWNVRFEGSLDADARSALESAEQVGGVTSESGGRHRVRSTGATAEEAVRRVREALDGHGSFSGFDAEPADG
ncbi:MAG TPA: hypothetical protein VLA98_06805 [Solirubrobacteraceae bacterium]|nr:hypothetical protein [Solirubrobacteraceae bacterium]HSD81330.1 hypothetical protein [Solirubrobacteraceae bacterium]